MAKSKTVIVSTEAIENPRRFLLDGEWVGIGGPITTIVKPPAIPVAIKEATKPQYKKLADRCPHLVTIE